MSDDDSAEKDAEFFRAAIGAVRPLKKTVRVVHANPPRPAHFSPQSAPICVADTLSDFANTPPPDDYLSNGLSRMTLRKLRHAHSQDQLDLHGLRSDAARQILQEFLHRASQENLRFVCVVHGKGLNSASGEAVLKIRTRHWLIQHPQVLAYCDATPQSGGSGAVLVLLRRTKDA